MIDSQPAASVFEIGPMLAQTQRWTQINSGTDNLAGLDKLACDLADAFSALPGNVSLEDAERVNTIDPDGALSTRDFGRHLVVRVRPEAKRRLLLTGHMDTVFSADHAFQTQSWIDAETLNGPGVADMKGGLAIMLAALTVFEQSPDANALGYDVLINSDEETGSRSSASLIAGLAQGKLAALTYEPAADPDGTLAGARPGSGNFAAVISGRSAHAGRNPADGRNAVVAAAALAIAIKGLELPGLTVNPAKIGGGSPNNVVPDHAVLHWNMRSGAQPLVDDYIGAAAEAISKVEREFDVRVELHGSITRPPKPLTPPSERLFKLVAECSSEMGRPLQWRPSGGVCDGNNISACGVPVVDTMGARGGSIHSAEEYLLIQSLPERAMLSLKVLTRIARGTFL